jgi:hypothetical protein
MAAVEAFSKWLSATSLSWAMAGGYPWLWPACETLHFIGMAMLVGVVGLLDLRMLGLVKGLPLKPLDRLLPWGVAGFAINVVTGFLFFAGDPFQYIHNSVFWLKMAFIAAAGLNVAAFYVTRLHGQVEAVGPGEDVPPAARLVAATSLLLWIGVIYWGRMLPFLGDAF